jgi:hypothetical protein
MPEQKTKDGSQVVEGLFADMDEVTRAFIYSEIFPRKYI